MRYNATMAVPLQGTPYQGGVYDNVLGAVRRLTLGGGIATKVGASYKASTEPMQHPTLWVAVGVAKAQASHPQGNAQKT